MSIQRRTFLQALATLGAATQLPPPVLASSRPPWSVGFDGVSGDLPELDLRLKGRIPEACVGTLYRNGPAGYERAGQRYRHWFDPDGMIQAFRIRQDGISHRGRFVRTEKFLREERAGRFLYNGAGSTIRDSQPVRSNESINVANTNVQSLNGELVALWEAGAPYRIDPHSLETRGRLIFSEELDGVPFSAHPHLDEQGELWNIGAVPFAGRPVLVLYRLGADGSLKHWRAHKLDFAGYMHDFVLTPRYLIALNSSAVIGSGDTFVDSMHWEPTRASQLLVFDRNDLELRATIEAPATFVFHFGNGWEDGDTLNFTACAYPDATIATHGMRRLASREPGPYHLPPELVRYRVSLAAKRAQIESLGTSMEFPGFDRRRPFDAQPLFGTGSQSRSASELGSAVQRVDPETGSVDRYDYGDGTIVEEPLFLPGPDGGYLIHSFLDYRRARSGVAVLAAAHLADGPIALASMDRVLPLGFHGCFLPGVEAETQVA